MNRAILVFIFIFTLYISCFAQSNQTESLTITTYYPSPYGVYRNLKLSPTTEPSGPALDRGVMFFNNSSDGIQYYNNSGWVKVEGLLVSGGGGGGGGGGSGDGYWEENPTTHYIYNNNSGGKVIITGPPDGNGEIFQVEGDMRVMHKPPLGDGNTLLYLTRWDQTNSAGLAFGSWAGTDPTGYVIRHIGNPSKLHIGNRTDNFVTVDSTGKMGIGTINPQQQLDVNGAMRLAPGPAPAATPAGSIFYDSTRDTLRYRDATAPAQWISSISEYGSVTIPAGQTTWTVLFRKPYTTAPVVIATPVGVMEDMVFVRNFRLTNTYVEFDMDVLRGDGTISGISSSPQQINYIVIPR